MTTFGAMKAFAIATLLGLIAAMPGIGASEALAQAPAPPNATAIRQAIDRGRMIYAYDQAAWHGTDDMLLKVPHPEAVIGGWVVDGPAESPELIFFDKNED